MVEGLAPPTRAVVHSQETICRRLRIQYASLHMCGVNQFWIIVFFTAVKPANNSLFCIELIQRSESSLRRHKLGLTDQSILSNDDKIILYKILILLRHPDRPRTKTAANGNSYFWEKNEKKNVLNSSLSNVKTLIYLMLNAQAFILEKY